MDSRWIELIVFSALLVLMLLALYLARKKGYIDEVFGMLYEMVCRAETYFEGNGRGAEKKEWVVCQIHQALPDWAKMFVSEKDIDRLIEAAVEKMKTSLSNKIKDDAF